MKVNKKVVCLGMLAGFTLVLSGCKTQTNTIRTNEFTISGEEVYNETLKNSPQTVLEANLKASDVKMLDKIYGSGNIDESKLLSQAKVVSGAAYLTQIGQDSGLIVTNDDEAKKALRYMEQQKFAAKDFAGDLITDDEAKNFANKNATFSVKHVLVKTEEDAKKMKEYLTSGAENFDTLKQKSTEAKAKAKTQEEATFTSDKGIAVGEAADYANASKGQFVPEFEEGGLTKSPLNAWSDPIKTRFGYHVQFVYARNGFYKEGDDLSPSKKSAVESIILTKKSDSAAAKVAMIKMREKHNFSIEDETLKKEYETYKENVNKLFATEKEAALSGAASKTNQQLTPGV